MSRGQEATVAAAVEALPFTLRMPTDRAANNADGAELNVGINHIDVQVVLDPTMALRGECRNGYGGPVIALREWDEQVFLHELLHAATGYAQPLLAATYPPEGHEVIARIEVALWETGWRMTTDAGLRGRVEALAEQLDNEADGICPRGHYDKKDKAWRVAHVRRRVAEDLRTVLADTSVTPSSESQTMPDLLGSLQAAVDRARAARGGEGT